MTARDVSGFTPSQNGLHFANRFPSQPALRLGLRGVAELGIGNTADGLCGGLCFTARDLFEAGLQPPATADPPPFGTAWLDYLVARQIDSFDWLRVPFRFYVLQLRGRAALRPALRDEWPKVRADIDDGRLSMLGLIRATGPNPLRLARNHQVMCFGFEVAPDRLTLRIYDPNWPDRDDVELRFDLGRPGPGRRPGARRQPNGSGQPTAEQSTGEPLVTFFRAPYRPRDPRPWS
jgi:hypothetical protein